MSGYELWEVGKTAPESIRQICPRSDGFSLIVQNHLTLLAHLSNLTDSEIRLFKKGTIETAFYAEGGMWLGQMRFAEDKKITMDMPFNAAIYRSPESREMCLKTLNESNIIEILLVDISTFKVCAMRLVSIPNAFIQSLRDAVKIQYETPDFTRNYELWIDKVYRFYDPAALWRESTRTGNLGTI